MGRIRAEQGPVDPPGWCRVGPWWVPGGGTCDKKVAGHRQGWGLVLVGAAAARVTGRSSGGGTARGGDKRRR